ncbi:BON domain-containing protein [Hydrocarboniphaga effusa]|jgi:osmotically-inducible protein OsmY|uniref:BON domain-containing protein n=2 Tax=Hydrocarboniphaga effusa TaxID=243629 RepID=UPI0035B1407F
MSAGMIRSTLQAATLALAALALPAMAQDDSPIQGFEARSPRVEVVQDFTPFKMSEADLAITREVIAVLEADPLLKGNIRVSTLNGVVMLAGTVKSVPMIYRAVELSRKIANVNQVETNELWRG